MKTIEQVTAECAQRLAFITTALAQIQGLTREALELYAAGDVDAAWERIDRAYDLETDIFCSEKITGPIWEQIEAAEHRTKKGTP